METLEAISNKSVQNIELEEFAVHFGANVEDIPTQSRKIINSQDFSYYDIVGKERDALILSILNKIAADTQVVAGKERVDVWQSGWTENLEEFEKTNYSFSSLIPKFIRPRQVVRLNQDYVMPSNPYFEYDFYRVFRAWLFSSFFKEVDHIYEFGCGTGFNLVELAKMYPSKKFIGLDFVSSSCELVKKIAQVYQLPIRSYLFDMRFPDNTCEIKSNSAIYTIGAIEQLASNIEPMLQYLLSQKPMLCVHIEPTVELYDETVLADYLAAQFHRKRGYTVGFLPRLRELAESKQIDLLKVKRLHFGSLYMEGYTLIIWKPKT